MRNYAFMLRREIRLENLPTIGWDAFISAYNSSERVRLIWNEVRCPNSAWAMHAEYGYPAAEHPPGVILSSLDLDESAFADNLIDNVKDRIGKPLSAAKIGVDITGFMRPELIALTSKLANTGATRVDFLYSEPKRYKRKGWQEFAQGNVKFTRQVMGCEGLHDPDTSQDFLLIGTGYDDVLMSSVAEHKSHARKALMFGLPSLAPDMYQENVWRVSRAAESIGAGFHSAPDEIFAPANDPFETARVISEVIDQGRQNKRIQNAYLSPLGTKAQVLGFALYYAAECRGNTATSVILPFAQSYTRETSEGMGRIWLYSVDFALLT